MVITEPHSPEEVAWPRRLLCLSVLAAVTVSVIYLPQPLLAELAESLHVGRDQAGLVATTVQSGYAVGIFLLVPLADRIQPRRQIAVQLTVLAVTLAVTAWLPSLSAVAVGFLVVGLWANIPQLVISTAVTLGPPGTSARTTAYLVAAVFVGIFGGRVLAGLLGSTLGWRWTCVAFAVVVALLVPVARGVIPPEIPRRSGAGYARLLISTVGVLGRSRALRQAAVMQLCAFAAFNSVWTVMVLHLTSPTWGWSTAAASLFGLVGLSAGVVAPLTAGVVSRLSPTVVMVAALGAMAAATAALLVDSASWGLVVSVFVMTAANQTLQASNQHRVLAAERVRPGQANTMFMVFVFIGGSFGAALGTVAFAHAGMPAVAVAGLALLAVSISAWVLTARDSRTTQRHSAHGGVGT
ncbi:MFS transporter [Streptomyces albidoflavus]